MKLLHYPEIVIPMSDLKKYVLYSDKISSIVPRDVHFDENHFDKSLKESIIAMSYLEELGMYEKTYSSDILRSHQSSLENEFMKRVEGREICKRIKDGYEPEEFWELYLSKLDFMTVYFLFQEGLAKKGNRYTIYVAAEIAAIYMGLLADYAATYGDTYYSTVTSKAFYKGIVYKPIENNDQILKLKFSLSDILPVPVENASLEDIIRFKQSRTDELLRFQQLIKETQHLLNNYDDVREFRERIEIFEKQILLQMNELKSLLRENNINFITNTFDSFLNAPQSLLKSFISKKGFVRLSPIVEKSHKKNKLVRENPVSYLLSAREDGIINN